MSDVVERARELLRFQPHAPERLHELLGEAVDEIERLRAALGDAWDDGNGCGLDGWIGPGIGDSRGVDDEAVHRRDRFLTAALGDGVGHHCEAVAKLDELTQEFTWSWPNGTAPGVPGYGYPVPSRAEAIHESGCNNPQNANIVTRHVTPWRPA